MLTLLPQELQGPSHNQGSQILGNAALTKRSTVGGIADFSILIMHALQMRWGLYWFLFAVLCFLCGNVVPVILHNEVCVCVCVCVCACVCVCVCVAHVTSADPLLLSL